MGGTGWLGWLICCGMNLILSGLLAYAQFVCSFTRIRVNRILSFHSILLSMLNSTRYYDASAKDSSNRCWDVSAV
jgi:hypothetical protein